MYAVSGVTGHTGRIAAETLLAGGAPVRVLVRDEAQGAPWRARGAEVAVADLWDGDALTRALTGVAGAYLLSPPRLAAADPLAEATRLGQAFAHALREAHVPHVVLLSSVGSQHAAGTGPIRTTHGLEGLLDEVGVPRTYVRAASFLENWGAVVAPAKSDGVLPTFIPADKRYAQVSVRDIGRVAAEALLQGPSGRRVIELAGPRDLTAEDVAATLGGLLGRPVRAHAYPAAAAAQVYQGYGMSPGAASLMAEMYAGIESGVVSFEGTPVRGLVTAEDVLRALIAA
jgi:uncharacterized protein YbjT (DUF2867 family)